MREIDLIHRQIELVAVSIGGRVQRLHDTLQALSFMTKCLFTHASATPAAVAQWVEQEKFEVLESGFFESRERVEKARLHGPDNFDATLYWRATLRDHEETRRRFYLLHSLRPYVGTLHRQFKGVAWIYFQSAHSPHATLAAPSSAPDTIVPADFVWHEYHSFTIVRPEINPERSIRWSPPTVDYGGQGLISCVSIPVYADDGLFLGVWTMDIRLAELHADLALEPVGSVGSRQTNFLTDFAGRLIAHPMLDPAAHEEKGSVHDEMVSCLGGDFSSLDVPALASRGHGEIELTDARGQRLVVAFRTVPEINWILFASFPKADMIEATQAAFKRAFDKLGSGDLSFRLDAVGDEMMQQLIASYNDMTHTLQESLRRREEVEIEKRKMVMHQERLARELEIAVTIQLAMLPRSPAHPEFEFAGMMKPAEEVGGDFYDVLSRNGNLWLTIGDVSSHGLGAGLVMMITQAVVQSVFETNPESPADEVLRRVNQLLHSHMSKGLGQGHYLTGQVFLHRGEGTFDCVGGHLWPIVIHARSKTIEVVEVLGPWLGIVPQLPRVPITRLTLAPGDVMCLYSDGLTEARNADGEFFGLDRLRDILLELVGSGRSLQSCAAELLERIAQFAPVQDDDRTVLFVRYVGS